MQIYGWEHFAVCYHPGKSCDHKQCECGDVSNLLCDLSLTRLKGYVNLWVESPHGEPLSCHVCWPLIESTWKYEVFNMSDDLKKPRD